MMRRRSVFCALALFPLMMSGCAVPDADLLYACSGRFSVSGTDRDGKQFAVSGKYDFRRRRDLIRLDLMTPLNGILARIDATSTEASLTLHGNEDPLTASDPESLMMQLLGFSFPVDAVERWLKDDRPEFHEYGWRIRILQRFPDGSAKTVRAARTMPAVTVTLAADPR